MGVTYKSCGCNDGPNSVAATHRGRSVYKHILCVLFALVFCSSPLSPGFAQPPEEEEFGLGSGVGTGGGTGGYIDSAIVTNKVRFRFDAAYDNPTPDRAEFLYPKCGCFGGSAPGPPLVETGIDFQEFSLYAESLLLSDLISGFVEIPFRLINPEQNNNTGGLSDINVGLKAALWVDQAHYLTFQFRTYIPSGDGADGLGTEHVSLEPGLLFMKRCGNGTTIEGEIRDFIPIDGTEGWAGNVLRYGLGVAHTLYTEGRFSCTPVVETVAWSVLSGDVLKAASPTIVSVESAETTIVNIKLGARFNLAQNAAVMERSLSTLAMATR